MSVQKITTDHPIFTSPAFLRDKVSFNVLVVHAGLEGAETYSDEETFIITVSKEKDTVWAWTINDISDEKCQEMWRFIEYACMDSASGYHIFLKSVIVNRSPVRLKTIRNRFAYQCKKLNSIVESYGSIHKATEDDFATIADLIAKCDGVEAEEAENKARHFLEDYIPYFWLDGGGSAVTMSVLKPSVDGFVRIGGLYVRPDCRSMGYERSLIHQMSQYIIDDGKTPMLYVTDSKKNNSSTRYTDMGFIRCGRIAEVELA